MDYKENKMRKRITLLLLGIITISCTQQPDKEIILSDKKAASIFMTKTEEGLPLVYWVELNELSQKTNVSFVTLTPEGLPIGKNITIDVTSGCNDGHGEGAPKMVVKSDGTMIVLFNRKKTSKVNRFSSDLLYSQSFDHGITWSEPKKITSSDNQDASAGYADLEILPDGEAAAIWLDSRNRQPYSEIYFAKTNGLLGFGMDKKIGTGSCQCCRTELFVSKDGIIHGVYRGILPDSSRDMVYIHSENNGETFSDPVCVSSDKWKIDGCPHTGPTMTMSNNNLYFSWFTQGTGSGLFTTESHDGKIFSPRKKVTDDLLVSHPQMISTDDGTIITSWERFSVVDEKTVKNIMIKVEKNNQEKLIAITNSTRRNEFSTLLALDNENILVAWKTEENSKSWVSIKKIAY